MVRYKEIVKEIPNEELMTSGHLACQGCGATIGMRLALKVLGKRTIVTIPACCWAVIPGPYPYSALKVPVLHTAFETTATAASGIRAALDIRGIKDVNVLAWAGDGGTFDIGMQALSAACERNEDIIYICYDNEAYMNTGIQRSSATPLYSWTTTTPTNDSKAEPKKDLPLILAAHGIGYVATANVAYPEDYIKKLIKARDMKGTTRFIHLFSPCTAGWKISSDQSLECAKRATDSRVFPLYEIINGEHFSLTLDPEPTSVEEYLKMQGRFRHLTKEMIENVQKHVDKKWQRLMKLIEIS